MGEYALYKGSEIKIGTCESMYYLRADQATLVTPLDGNVRPIADALHLLFRFPFPNEDNREPGDFEPFVTAGLHIPVPDGVTHGQVQFTAKGYNTMLPCPESPEATGLKIHRNGFGGAVRIAYQRVWNGHLALVCQCGGCERAYRLPEIEDAQQVIDALRAEAKQRRASDRYWHESGEDTTKHVDPGAYYETIADRIIAGYTAPPAWVAAAFASV